MIIYQSEGGRSEKTQVGPSKKWLRQIQSVIYVPGLSTLSDLSRMVAQPQPSFLCCPRPPSPHSSSLTSVYPYPPSTFIHHKHPSSDTVLIHSLQMPTQSQYSLTRSSRQLPFYTSYLQHLLIPNTIHCDAPTKLLKHFISRTFAFLLSALLSTLSSLQRRWYNDPFI